MVNFILLTRRNDPHTCWTISAIISYVHLKNFPVSSTEFEPVTSAMPGQCSYQLSYEATQMWPGQFVGLLCSCERNDECSLEHMSPTNWPAHIWVASWLSWLEHCTGIKEVMSANPFEDTWTFFRCTYETIAEIVQQVWGSFFQFISQPHLTNIGHQDQVAQSMISTNRC